MLKWLHIKNLALVHEADLEFGPGFNAITGETGAGKSVLMGGVALLLGGRFDKSAIRQGTDRCEISGEFLLEEATAGEVARLLEENGIEPCEGNQLLIIRADGSFSTPLPPPHRFCGQSANSLSTSIRPMRPTDSCAPPRS